VAVLKPGGSFHFQHHGDIMRASRTKGRSGALQNGKPHRADELYRGRNGILRCIRSVTCAEELLSDFGDLHKIAVPPGANMQQDLWVARKLPHSRQKPAQPLTHHEDCDYRRPGHSGALQRSARWFEQFAVRLVEEYGHDVTVYAATILRRPQSQLSRGPACFSSGARREKVRKHSSTARFRFCTRLSPLRFGLCAGPGNAPLSWPLKLRRFPILFHTDGLDGNGANGAAAAEYYKWSEKVSAPSAIGWSRRARMQKYYVDDYRAQSSFIPYSGVVGDPPAPDSLSRFGLQRRGFYLCVARLAGDNVDL